MEIIKLPIRLIPLGCAIACLVFLAGCVNLATYQTAEVLTEPGWQTGTGVSMYFNKAALPIVETWGRKYINDKTDAGIKLYTFGSIVDIKRQFVNTRSLDLAVDFGFILLPNRPFTEMGFVNLLYPQILTTLHANQSLSATLALKAISGYSYTDKKFYSPYDEIESNKSYFPGATLTLALGKPKKFIIMPEIGAFVDGDGMKYPTMGISFSTYHFD